jgi:uncharacterized protein (TIGR00730 family)
VAESASRSKISTLFYFMASQPTSPTCSIPDLQDLLNPALSPRKKELLEDMIKTVIGLGDDDAPLADIKLLRRALAEIRYAMGVFAKYRDRRKVAVFGSARTKPDAPEYRLAMEFSRRIVEAGYMVITGGGDGIMGAAQKGAGAENSFGLNIQLPFEQRANEVIQGDPKLINFKYFFTRKLYFLKETNAVVLFPGGFGTLDEGFEALTLTQTGKTQIVPLILIDKVNGYYWEMWRRFLDNDLLELGLISESDFHLFHITHSVEEAVEEILRFYSVFHSYRWVRERLVIRINKPLSASALDELNGQFRPILIEGSIEQREALPEEREETTIADKPRLVLVPAKKDFGLLRLLIDKINCLGA